jgi:MFS family permease
MNLDELIEGWRSQDASTFYGVLDKTRLHQVLREEQAKLEKLSRRGLWGGYVFGVAPLLISSALFLSIMFQANYDDVLIVWDYVVGVVGVAAAMVVAWTLLALRRSQRARERGFGDSLRDHLRRRIAQMDDEATRERRLGLITLGAGLICAVTIPVVQDRIAHVPVPYSEMDWPSPFWTVVILGFLCLELFWWGPRRERRKNLPRRRHLEALLKELDGQ